jgi:NADH-quinone oxidoreductase subunit A
MLSHIVEGQENPLAQVSTGRLYEVQKYCALSNHCWSGYWIVANRRARKRSWADAGWLPQTSASKPFVPGRGKCAIGATFWVFPSRGHRQNSLSCALWCAALSLRIIPNQRICGPFETAGKKATPMTGILQNYLPLVVFVAVAGLIGLVLLIAPFLVAFQQPDPEKLSAYECGFNAFDDARMKFDVRFYLVAILFIIFDLEVAFLFPWAVAFGKLGATGFWSMVVFLAVLTVGFAYEWKKGALEWD